MKSFEEPKVSRRGARAALVVALLMAATLGTVVVAQAGIVSGGGKSKTDCYAELQVQSLSGSKTVECADGNLACDGDGQCDGTCTFRVAVCPNQSDPNLADCTPPTSLASLSAKSAGKTGIVIPNPADLTGSACGDVVDLRVPLKRSGLKPGRAKVIIKATRGDGGKPKKEKDTVIFKCNPCPCPRNPAGGPDELVVTVLPSDSTLQGSDLDNGWTGISHNFPVPNDSKLKFCLSGCDGTTANPVCASTGPTGPGTDNGVVFGPPLPLVAGGVPVCVVNRFQPGPVTGTGNLVTGEMSGTVNLFSDVWVTDATRVCPRCETGTCDSGTNRNGPCTVDGTVRVQNSLSPNKLFKLSKDCPPGGNPVSTLDIPLPLTTGTVATPGTGGSKPCREKEDLGVPVKDNDCTGGSCNSPCQVGSDACVTTIPDPSNLAQQICVDIKGGLSQVCCDNNPALPCFPTQAGGPGIVRTGRPVPPTPAVPEPTYPKTSEGTAIVATFCEAATGNANIDTVTGLPGPGALLFTARLVFSKLP